MGRLALDRDVEVAPADPAGVDRDPGDHATTGAGDRLHAEQGRQAEGGRGELEDGRICWSG